MPARGGRVGGWRLGAVSRCALLSLATTLASGDALAADNSEAARAHAAQLRADADRLFSEGKYEAALIVLEQGYELTGDPLFVFNRGVTYHSQGNCEKARGSYELYLDVDPAGPKRAEAVQGLQDLQPICGGVRASPARGSIPTLASPPSSVGPSSSTQSPVERPAVHVASTESLQPRPFAADSRAILPWSLLGASGVALALSGVMGALWYDARSEHESLVQSAVNGAQTWDVCCARRDGKVQASRARYAGLAIGFGMASVMLGGAGTALILLTPSTAAGPGTAAVSYGFQF